MIVKTKVSWQDCGRIKTHEVPDVITLYNFGAMFGLPDASPFVTKVHMLLKLANLPYETDTKGFNRAPKQKLPFITDDEKIIADSSFIRFHVEQKYGFDFDAELSDEQKAIAWAVEKMLEEHLYFMMMRIRWADDANFARGPANFFNAAPLPIRGLIRRMVRKGVLKTLRAQGMGRHTDTEMLQLASKCLTSLSTILGDKAYLMGNKPCGADASVFAFSASILCPVFESAIRQEAETHENLVRYVERIKQQYFPELMQ
jgi:glutathione S-transferase